MNRALTMVAVVLPLALAATGAAAKVSAGSDTMPIVFSAVGGAVLGGVIYLLLYTVSVVVGHTESAPVATDNKRRRQLQADKRRLLRAIKEIEFDAALHKLGADEAARLVAPMRERTMRLLREIDEATVGGPVAPDERINIEVAQRQQKAAT